jgi:OOP family OmpA-OmpF porin
MNRTIALTAAGVLLAASAGAHAQAVDTRLRMDTGFYVGTGIGHSEARDFCAQLGGACDAKDMTWNIFAGYQLNRHFAIEAGYSDFGDATTSGLIGGRPVAVTATTKAVELVGLGLLPFGERFALYGKLGFFRYDSDGSSTGAVVTSASDKGTELTFGVGAEYNFNPNFATRVEWQRYRGVGSGIAGSDNADISVVRIGGRYTF